MHEFAKLVGMGVRFSAHVEGRMEERGFSEIELWTMLDNATKLVPAHHPGRWVIHTRHARQPWRVVVEPDSDDQILMIVTAYPSKQDLFLKIRDAFAAPQESDLRAEKAAMSWLHDKLSVPSVVCFHEENNTQYLLMTRIAGVSGVHEDARIDPPGLIRMFAHGLREIHAIPVDSCPSDWRFERYFAWATDLIDSGVLDSQIPKGGTRNVLRDELASIRDDLPPEDVVFTHGDYCLPNVMILNGHLSGYIDWGYAGIGDRYLDFVAAYNTIRRNLGGEWVPLFFREYGQELDQAKLSVYQRIHDFVD